MSRGYQRAGTPRNSHSAAAHRGGGINSRAIIKGHIMIRNMLLWLAMLAAAIAPSAAHAGDPLAAAAYVLGGQANSALNGHTILGEKLRRAAARAQVANPITARPWLAPPTYANNTVMRTGQVILNGGNWYTSAIAGTTASSGSGPTSYTASGTFIQDGTAYFQYLSGAVTPDPGTGAPTVTTTTTDPALGLKWYPQTLPARYKVRGGTPAAYLTYGWQFTTFQASASAIEANSAAVETMSDAAKVAVFVPANANYGILVDGRYIQPGGYTFSQDSYVVIDWSSTSGRMPHRYRIECWKSTLTITTTALFGFLETAQTESIWAPTDSDEVRAVVVGDSYLVGATSVPGIPGHHLHSQLGALLGWSDTWNFGIPGTGYVSQGTGPYYTFDQRIAQIAALNPDIVVTIGSVNDKVAATSAAQITAAVAQYVTDFRVAMPKVPLVIFGCQPVNTVANMGGSSGLTAAQVEAAIQAGVTQANQPLTFFIPMATDAVPWVTGTWNNTGVAIGTGAPLNSAWLVGTDGVHYPEYGPGYYARHMAEAIRSSVLPGL